MERPRLVLTGLCPQLDNLQWSSDTRLRVGRYSGDLDVVLHDPTISNRHAEFVWTVAGWVVRDLNSKAGTILDGQPVPSKGAPLRHGAQVQLGRLLLGVEIHEPIYTASPPAPSSLLAPPAE